MLEALLELLEIEEKVDEIIEEHKKKRGQIRGNNN